MPIAPIELWLELIGRDPDQAAGKSSVVCSPGCIVMPAIGQRRIAGEGLPETPIGAVSPTGATPISPSLEPVHKRARLDSTRRILIGVRPPGVATWAVWPIRLPIRAWPIGDSFEIMPAVGLASIAPTMV